MITTTSCIILILLCEGKTVYCEGFVQVAMPCVRNTIGMRFLTSEFLLYKKENAQIHIFGTRERQAYIG